MLDQKMNERDDDPGAAQTSSSPATLSIDGSASTISASDVQEILGYVSEALTRFGTPGAPYASGDVVHLRLPNDVARVRLGPWAERWQQLDESTRRLRTNEVARQLVQPHKLATSMAPTKAMPNLTPLLMAVIAFGIAGYGYVHFNETGFGAASESGPPVDRRAKPPSGATAMGGKARSEGHDRSERVCEATRARVVRGATVSIADVDGWVVEYLAYKKGGSERLDTHPALSKYFADPASKDGSKFHWDQEPDMVSLDTSTTLAVVHREDLARPQGEAGGATHGIRITFGGTLVEPYFREKDRGKYFHVANSLSEDLGVTHAGLYARCASGDTHHLGSWFRGIDDDDAAAAMMFVLGAYADPPHIASPFYREVGSRDFDHSLAFDSISHATEKLDRPFLASVLGRQGGHIMGSTSGASLITFPFKDGNRAARASRELARLLEMAPVPIAPERP